MFKFPIWVEKLFLFHDMLHFEAPELTFTETVAPTVLDFGLLVLYTLAAFAGAFVAFLRYDVR